MTRTSSVAAVALTALLCALLSPASPARATADTPPTLLPHLAAPCQDVVFVGARGSGQSADSDRGLGAQVDSVLQAYVAAVPGHRVAYWPLIYSAQDVKVLAPPTTQMYFDGMDGGVTSALQVLTTRSRTCPRENYVLAGYSQGAMVMHRASMLAPSYGVPFGRIDGIVLLADGDRQKRRAETSLGTAVESSGSGVTWAFETTAQAMTVFDAPTQKYPTSIRGRVFSVCDAGDSVCDAGVAFRRVRSMTEGFEIHTTHYVGTGPVLQAAAAVAGRTSARPSTPQMALVPETLPEPILGTPYSADLTVRWGESPYTLDVVTGALPPGLQLTYRKGTGRATISGTPTRPGPFEARIQVRDRKGQVLNRELLLQVDDPWAEPVPASRTLATGRAHSCAIGSTGAVRCWGENASGQLGDGFTATRPSPVPVVGLPSTAKEVIAGNDFSCALLTDGEVWCWGAAAEVGTGTTSDQPLPVQVAGLTGQTQKVFAATTYACAISTGGHVRCWGDAPLVPGKQAVPVPGLESSVRELALGARHMCGLWTDTAMRCRGENLSGVIGIGSEGEIVRDWTAPIQMSSGVRTIAAGNWHTCAQKVGTSAPACWGWNNAGAIGMPADTVESSLAPIGIGMTGAATEIHSRGSFSCARTVSGAQECWGANGHGQLGTGVTSTAVEPAVLAGGAITFALVAPSSTHVCAVDEEEQIWCWGANGSGQLGDGSQEPRRSPVLVGEM